MRSFMAYPHLFYCLYHPLSIISPQFHHPPLIASVYKRHWTDVWLMFSHKIEETRITLRDAGFDLNPHRSGILHKQNAYFVICDV